MAEQPLDLSNLRFDEVDLTGSRIHGAYLVRTKVTDAWVQSLDLSGHIESVIVNGVEVAGFVRAELERRHPELQYLESRDVPGMQRAWAKVQEIAAATIERARLLPSAMLDASVDGEYSYLQTLRHLVFATDRWITGPVRGRPEPFHRFGLAYNGAPPEELAPLDLGATPTLDEMVAVRAERAGFVSELVLDATDESLARVVASPNGGTATVGDCIRIVIREEWWHHQYADRDLAVLRAGSAG